MARLLVAAAVVLAGCGSAPTPPPPSAASGVKRLSDEGTGKQHLSAAKHRTTRRHPSNVSRSLRRPSLESRHDWSGVAACESSSRWHLSTGMFDGGLQFLPHTWIDYGGGDFAPTADLATRAEQVTVAERVLAAQGIGAWPVCGRWLR